MLERLLLVVLTAAALAFGAVYSWGAWPLTAAAAIIGAWALARGRGGPPDADRRAVLRPLMVALVIVAAAIGLQVVPLPRAWLIDLSPATDQFLRQYELGYAIQPPATHALSIQPRATLSVLARYVGFAVLFAGLLYGGARIRFDRIAAGVVLAGLGLAIFGVLQKAALSPAAAHRVYGFWEPTFKGDPFGPFINRNHFAGWMVLAAGVGLGHALAVLERSRTPRHPGARRWLRWLTTPHASRFAFAAFATLAMGTAVIATRSRSGVGALLVTVATFTIAASRRGVGQRRIWTAVYGSAMALLALLWAGLSTTMSRFATASVDLASRWSAWQDTWAIARDFPWWGSGLGTYDAAMLVYQTGSRDTMFAQAHNDYLQLAAEGGVLVGVPIAIAVALLVRAVFRRSAAGSSDPAGQWRRLGAIAGLTGIAAQSFVEFSLQMPAIAALFVVVAAIALSPPERHLPHAHRI